MLSRIIKLVTLLWVCFLPFSNQMPLASDVISSPISSDSVTPLDSDSDLVIEPVRLEISLNRRLVSLYQGTTLISSYPVAIGRAGWQTPTGEFKVAQMLYNPTWIHPLTGEVVPGGAKRNPLGHYWIGFWTDGKDWIGFHGTNEPKSIGQPLSHGCIRMRNEDIIHIFYRVNIGTPVTVMQ